jgi:hypothetical protein
MFLERILYIISFIPQYISVQDNVHIIDVFHDFDSKHKKSHEEQALSTSASLLSSLLFNRRAF